MAVSPNAIFVNPAALNYDIPVMIAVAIACFPIFYTGKSIARWEGLLFLADDLAYSIYINPQHDQLPIFSRMMLSFAIPITIVTLIVNTFCTYRAKRKYQA